MLGRTVLRPIHILTERAKNLLKTNLLQLDGTTPICEDIGRFRLDLGGRGIRGWSVSRMSASYS